MSNPRQNRRRFGYVFVGIAVGLFLVGVVAVLGRLDANSAATQQVVTAIRTQQKGNATTLAATHAAAHDAARTARLVKSCVIPTGKCFLRGRARTGQAIGSINRSVIASAACAATLVRTYPAATPPDLTDRITACVVTQLSHRR